MSKCTKRQVGAVIVNSENVLRSTGYNGGPRWLAEEQGKDCATFCPAAKAGATACASDYAQCISVHAEINALLHTDTADRAGGSMFITCAPCMSCAKAIANSRISAVFWLETDKDSTAVAAFLQACSIMVEEVALV